MNQATFNLTTNPINSIQGIAANFSVTGASALTNMVGYYTSLTVAAGYSSTVSNGVGYWAADPTNNTSTPFTNFYLFRGATVTNGNGTTGTVSNFGINIGAFTAGAGTGGTVNNYAGQFNVPTGSGAGTTNNYGLAILGGSAASTTYSLYNNSPAKSYLAGSVGIGTTTPGGQFELSLDQGRKPSTNTWTTTSSENVLSPTFL